MKGADVDLLKFPIPLIHGSAGRRNMAHGTPSSRKIQIAHRSLGGCTA
jgi:hypothetical protein